MKNTTAVLIACVSVAACKDKDRSQSASAAQPSATTVEKPAAPAFKDIKELFPKGKVAPPAELASFIGAAFDEAKSNAKLPGYKNVEYFLGNDAFDRTHVHTFKLDTNVKAAQLEPILTAAWGAPKTDHTDTVWSDPAGGWEARLNSIGTAVIYNPIQPLAKIFGDDKLWGFETDRPIIGMTTEEFKTAYASKFVPATSKGIYEMKVLGTEVGRVSLDAREKNGKITGVHLYLDVTLDPSAADTIMAALAKRFGKSTVEPISEDTVFPVKPKLRVEHTKGLQQYSVLIGES